MGETEYSEALKLGKKEYRARIAKGQFPYLPVLDEILSEADIKTEQNMGLVQVPLDFVVGTSTMGRTYSFAANFMPILDEETEFAVKWSNLSDAQMNEGIRDPIKAFEYMNRYYVLEGNKRVSVLKYFNAVSIPAIVTRKIPKLSDDYDVRLYYEYMKFNEITGLCSVEFTKLGNADKLLSLVEPMAKAAVAAGADGLMIEVHNNPECALCDGAQSLKPEKYDTLLKEIKLIAEVVGKQL